MKISQIKNELLKNNHLFDKTIDINDVRSGKKYLFICDKGHIFEAEIKNTYQSGKFGCPVCSGRKIVKGVNDLFTTHPQYAQYLKNKEDGYSHSYGSNKKLIWICPDCKREMISTPNRIINKKTICSYCNKDNKSYAEKIMFNILEQLGEMFEIEKIFDWSDNKRYDFYLQIRNCIIELHGKQHYTERDFSYLSGRTYVEEQVNDNIKENMAKNIGKIKYYIVIDCSKSDFNFIRSNIIKSGLFDILDAHYKMIDWGECHQSALENTTKQICDDYNNGLNIKDLCEKYKYCHNSIVTKLKYGSEVGWCDYNPIEARRKAQRNNCMKSNIKQSKPVIQMDLDGNEICEFVSIQEAQRHVGAHIWDCLVGKRNSAGGYKWKYKYIRSESNDN